MTSSRSDQASLEDMLTFAETSGDELGEVARMVEAVPEYHFSHDEMRRLASERIFIRSEQAHFAALLSAGQVSRSAYLEMTDTLVVAFARRSEDILGRERFVALFGEAAYEPHGLIDRETFLGVDQFDQAPLLRAG